MSESRHMVTINTTVTTKLLSASGMCSVGRCLALHVATVQHTGAVHPHPRCHPGVGHMWGYSD